MSQLPFRVFSSLYANLKIRTKMLLLISSVVLACVFPLSIIVLYRNQDVVLQKTFEVCRNLGDNISNLATEELLINETYESTRRALSTLEKSNITGLKNVFVINIDGEYVAEYGNEVRLNTKAPPEVLDSILHLKEMSLSEIKGSSGETILEFSYPIFIHYREKNLRVGAAIFEFNRDEVYEPVVQVRTTILVVGGVLFLVGLGIAFYASFFFSRPIQKLSEGARIIGAGNLSHRIQIQGKDEIGKLANTFNEMTGKIQDFTQNLENMVEQRTEELHQSLQEVQALKTAQDGDYYLTSLLLEPIQENRNRSKTVDTKFIVEQKKKFSFRNWNSEIGGDICLTDKILLGGKEYTVFVNGDAMGKSIQGAGGALVFGVVFNAGLTRSKLSFKSDTFPEIWLKERFLDLHHVFQSFDGSMYISVCLGLIDNETGTMYYFNAEHPFTVLYRDGVASFLEEELVLRKIGTPDQEDKFRVRVFSLAPGDIVISGSDGRDDIVLGQDENGMKVVNEDENKFLELVLESEGDIQGIAEKLRQSGGLMDDLSLLQISYRTSEVEESKDVPFEILEEMNMILSRNLESGADPNKAANALMQLADQKGNYTEILEALYPMLLEGREYPKAVGILEVLLERDPTRNDLLYLLSLSKKECQELERAADIGERLYLRDSENLENLILLCRIYLQLKVFQRVEHLWNKAVSMNGDYPELKEIHTELQSAIQVENEEQKKRSIAKIKELLAEAENAYQAKNHAAAARKYQEILSLDPNESRSLFKLANCCFILNEVEEAILHYNQLISIDPQNVRARNNLASVYFREGKYDLAKEQWEKALQIQPDFFPAKKNLADLKAAKSESPIGIQ